MSTTFIKAKFKGIFKKKDSLFVGYHVQSEFYWIYIEIDDCEIINDFDVAIHKTLDFKFYEKIRTHRIWKFGRLREIFVRIGDEECYSGNLYNVLLKEVRLVKDESGLHGSDWRTIEAVVYFQIEQSKKSKPSIIATNSSVSGVNIFSNQLVSKEGQGGHLDQINYLGNYGASTISHIGDDGVSVISLPVSPKIGNWSKWILRLLLGIIFTLLLLYFWQINRTIFFVLFGVGLFWLIAQIFKIGNSFRIVGSILLLGIVGYFLAKLFYDTSSGSIPVAKKDGMIKLKALKMIDNNGDGKNDDELTERQIQWYDFMHSSYEANYSTSLKSYEHSVLEQGALKRSITRFSSSVEFYSQFYYGLFNIDKDKIKKIAKIFSDSSTHKHLDVVQTAEMVVTFVQEIPYWLVHEGNCEEILKSGNEFMVSYHRQHKPCLPNIVAGVQSPYEFVHNLKGDCDTRSLLAFSILKELNIACSVWVSEAYGHSILGVGAPVGYGIHKKVDGVSHYGVELTAKGYRLGMVAPNHNHSNNWDIAIFYNH